MHFDPTSKLSHSSKANKKLHCCRHIHESLLSRRWLTVTTKFGYCGLNWFPLLRADSYNLTNPAPPEHCKACDDLKIDKTTQTKCAPIAIEEITVSVR
jgi:hypothetical protein